MIRPLVHALSSCYMEPQVCAYSFMRALQTMGNMHPTYWTLLDHHWPIYPDQHRKLIGRMANLLDADVMRPEKNLGAHGGYNYMLSQIDPCAYVLTYDPDSDPQDFGWLEAMHTVMRAKPELTHVSLMIDEIVKNRHWQIEEIEGLRLAKDSRPEMYNVTLWRYDFIKEGIKATRPYYGGVEAAMFQQSNGRYLYDFRESYKRPIPHHLAYEKWKQMHAHQGYEKNFDEYIKEFPEPTQEETKLCTKRYWP